MRAKVFTGLALLTFLAILGTVTAAELNKIGLAQLILQGGGLTVLMAIFTILSKRR